MVKYFVHIMHVLYYFDDNISSVRSKYVVTMYIPVNAMYSICTKQILMADLLQICDRSATNMLHTSKSFVAVSNTDLYRSVTCKVCNISVTDCHGLFSIWVYT